MRLLVACRLAGLSALGAHYAGVKWRAQYEATQRSRASRRSRGCFRPQGDRDASARIVPREPRRSNPWLAAGGRRAWPRPVQGACGPKGEGRTLNAKAEILGPRKEPKSAWAAALVFPPAATRRRRASACPKTMARPSSRPLGAPPRQGDRFQRQAKPTVSRADRLGGLFGFTCKARDRAAGEGLRG